MKWISSKFNDKQISLALMLIRLAAGGLMIPHGFQKLTNFSMMVEKGFVDPFHIGVTASIGLTIFAEFFCAILVLVGLFTRIATLPLIIAMGVALFIAHNGEVFGDGSHAALYLLMYIAILVAGPGKYSLDKLLGK